MSSYNLTLLTDLYQLTMANGYWQNGMYDREAVFHLFFRKHPFKGKYTIACGLEQVINYLNNLRFDVDDIRFLGNLKDSKGENLFDESFLNYLQRFTFDCDVDAVPEGTIVFPHTPLVRIRGSLIQAQLIETTLLNLVNFSSLIATKGARIVEAAQGDEVLEFGLRRAQGPDGALSGSRAAYIGGCHATSNVLAGKMFDIPVKGTHAHSWVMCFDSEIEAFEKYAKAMPGNCVFLVDTYDTLEGVKKAIIVGRQLREKGYEMAGVRLDSGDLAELSKGARKLLDEAGFPNAAVVASNDLDEYRIAQLKEKGAKISVWGVGTRLATAYDQPALGGVYKLAAIREKNQDWEYRIKLSEQTIKVSNPGVLNTLRIIENGLPKMDVIINEEFDNDRNEMISFNDEKLTYNKDESHLLLESIFKKGKYIYQKPSIHTSREKTLKQLKLFKSINNYPVGLESELNELKIHLINIKKQ
ncbi:MAG: nicotinate phosphoribosyltransferase [Maribacter sp.]|jgi:nicotinate phosphoribosyltransferase